MKQNQSTIDPEIQRNFQHAQPQSFDPVIGGGSQPNINDVQNYMQALMQQVQVLQNKRVNLNTDIIGLFQTVSTAPTQSPNSPYQQIQIYVNGATLRLYVYDANAQTWHYATLDA